MECKRAVFFCSASNDIDPKYNQAARDAVRAACLLGYEIVSGGGNRGIMKTVCETAEECGALNVGILPRFMVGLDYKGLSQTIWTDTMSVRKEALRNGVGLVVTLPGGMGSMDEFFESFVLVKLKQMQARLIVCNFFGFYEPLKALMQHFVATNMLTEEDYNLVEFVDTPEEFAKAIEE